MGNLYKHIFENVETFKDLFDNAHDLIHLVEPDGTIIYVNNSWASVLGYTTDEINGRSIYSFVEKADRERFLEYRQRVLADPALKTEIVIGLSAKNGGTVFCEGFVSWKLVDNKPLYTRGIFRDVTRRLQNEAKLQRIRLELEEREENLQKLLTFAPDAIIVIDTDSRVTFWNPKAELIFGWTAAEVVGKPLADLIIPTQFREAHWQGMQRFMATGNAVVLNKTIEITALDRDLREFYISLTISTTQQKGKLAFTAFIRDIDEQKRNHLELEKKRAELQASNKELEQFAHVASHDLKEPVRKVMFFLERLKTELQEVLTEKAIGYFGKIDRSTRRLTQMIDGVLQYSTLRGEQATFEEIDLSDLVLKLKDDLELLIEEKEAKVESIALPVVEGSAFLLYQLFYNLVHNALKFARPGVKPVIQIMGSTYERSEPGEGPASNARCVEIIVKDNGIGFDQHHAKKIFNTFYRLHNRDQFEGTGLGLSLCKNIVERHNGSIRANGQVNNGAEFVITLPERQP